jgi:hypothetical protein
MACVLVWRLARSTAPQAPAARKLLMQLSGRQVAWGQEFTEEALLAGLWVLLAMVAVEVVFFNEWPVLGADLAERPAHEVCTL